jgi:hypothetical protein
MNIEIIEEPIGFHLHGISGVVENEQYAAVGLRLMDAMWQAVKGAKIPNTGINHWVYLPAGRMFVGVQLRNPQQRPLPDQLEPLEFELRRHEARPRRPVSGLTAEVEGLAGRACRSWRSYRLPVARGLRASLRGGDQAGNDDIDLPPGERSVIQLGWAA